MKKIVITGASGLLGGRLVKYFAALDYKVYAISSKSNIESKQNNVFYITHDLMNPSGLKSLLHDADFIIHASGVNAQQSVSDPLFAFDFNINTTINICKSIKHLSNTRILYISTAHVYGSPLTGNISESKCVNNNHPYALSHFAAESIITTLNYDTTRGIIIRLSNSFGFPVNKDTNCWMLFVNDIAQQLILENQLKITSNINQVRDFVPIKYVLNAIEHLLLLENDHLDNGMFNVGSGTTTSLINMANRVAERYTELSNGLIPKIITSSDNPQVDNNFKFSVDKLLSTGFQNLSDDIIDKEIDDLLLACRI